MIELPHTAGCLVCGRENPRGLRLTLQVDPDKGIVTTHFTPTDLHIGFEGIIHGGVIATVLDEAMVWAATWRGRRFCVCGELSVRFRNAVRPGDELRIEAFVEFSRPKLVECASKVFDRTGKLLATGSGKYVPMSTDQHKAMTNTLVDEPATAESAAVLRS
jgi:acyl-coenzyme A thioesterase PaaI-like protein